MSKILISNEELLRATTLMSKECMREAFKDPAEYPHRFERVGEYNGIIFVNDSWATTVNATWYSLELLQQQVIWIMGGKSNGNDYSPLIDLVRKKVESIICLDEHNDKVFNAFSDCSVIIHADTIQEAVKQSLFFAKPKQTILFSPTCGTRSAMDTYCTRGQAFKKAVMAYT